jgi:GDP-L-fucose synthase
MTTLITGGTGLIGSEFKTGIKVSSAQCNLRDTNAVTQLFSDYCPDSVIHTAAKVGGVAANTKYVYDFFLENTLINNNVIDQARSNGVKKLLAFTSTCIFPNQVEYPLKESYMHFGPPHESNYGYAYSKRMLDVQIQACNQQYKTKYFTVVPTNVYGPKDNYNLDNGHVLPALIHRCYLAKEQGIDFEVWGSGAPLREFIFSRDVANICEILLDKYQDTAPVIISTSQEVSIKQVVALICDIIGFKGNVVWNTSKPEGQFRKPTDTARLKSVIGNYQFVDLKAGLEETIDYFISNYQSVRK